MPERSSQTCRRSRAPQTLATSSRGGRRRGRRGRAGRALRPVRRGGLRGAPPCRPPRAPRRLAWSSRLFPRSVQRPWRPATSSRPWPPSCITVAEAQARVREQGAPRMGLRQRQRTLRAADAGEVKLDVSSVPRAADADDVEPWGRRRGRRGRAGRALRPVGRGRWRGAPLCRLPRAPRRLARSSRSHPPSSQAPVEADDIDPAVAAIVHRSGRGPSALS